MVSMFASFRSTLALAATLVFPVASGVALAQQQASLRPIRISGSSTVYPIVQAGIKAFRQTAAGKGVGVSLKETGSSPGSRDLCSGHVWNSNASSSINSKEWTGCHATGIRFLSTTLSF